MSDRGLLSKRLLLSVLCAMAMSLFVVPGCSDPEVGVVPKSKKSKEEIMKGIDGPDRAGKKKATKSARQR